MKGKAIKRVYLMTPHKAVAFSLKKILLSLSYLVYIDFEIDSLAQLAPLAPCIQSNGQLLFMMDTALHLSDANLSGIDWVLQRLRCKMELLVPVVFLHFRSRLCLKNKYEYRIIHEPGHQILIYPFSLFKLLGAVSSAQSLSKAQLCKIEEKYGEYGWKDRSKNVAHDLTNLIPQLREMVSNGSKIDCSNEAYKKLTIAVEDLLSCDPKWIEDMSITNLLESGKSLFKGLKDAVSRSKNSDKQKMYLEAISEWINNLRLAIYK